MMEAVSNRQLAPASDVVGAFHSGESHKGQDERSLVHAMQSVGFAAQRMPLSGAAGGKFVGGILFPTGWRAFLMRATRPN